MNNSGSKYPRKSNPIQTREVSECFYTCTKQCIDICHRQTDNGPCLNDLKHMDIRVCHLGWVHLHSAGYVC